MGGREVFGKEEMKDFIIGMIANIIFFSLLFWAVI